MSGYISFSVRLADIGFPDAVRTLRHHEYFRPVSLCAIEAHEGGDRWFLSGYALEDFADRFSAQAPSNPASVVRISGSSNENASYLDSVAGLINTRKSISGLSPFEERCEDERITFIRNLAIGDHEITKCEEWFHNSSNAVIYLYGTIDLEVGRPSVASSHAFRQLTGSVRDVGSPLVLLRASRVPNIDARMEIGLSTWSDVWIGTNNMCRLVSVAETLTGTERRQLVSASLAVEGSRFQSHRAEIRSAFSKIVSHDLNQ